MPRKNPISSQPSAKECASHTTTRFLHLLGDSMTSGGDLVEQILSLPQDSRWSIGLDAWIIKDGNYRDFAVGDRAEFALQFYLVNTIEFLGDSAVGAVKVYEDVYDVVGRVVHVDPSSWVLDFGLQAYREEPPPSELSPGKIIRTRISLGVDPFMYFENLRHNLTYPDLIYTWDIRAIRLETAPFVLNGNVWVRDEAKRGRAKIPRTDAWKDDAGNGDYVLDCDLVAIPPKRSRSTAI